MFHHFRPSLLAFQYKPHFSTLHLSLPIFVITCPSRTWSFLVLYHSGFSVRGRQRLQRRMYRGVLRPCACKGCYKHTCSLSHTLSLSLSVVVWVRVRAASKDACVCLCMCLTDCLSPLFSLPLSPSLSLSHALTNTHKHTTFDATPISGHRNSHKLYGARCIL